MFRPKGWLLSPIHRQDLLWYDSKLQTQPVNKHLLLVYRAQNTARLDVELLTETALVHGIAGFTAKSGGQAAVETVADPEGPVGAYQ